MPAWPALRDQRIGVFAGKTPFDVVDVVLQFLAQRDGFLQFALDGRDPPVERVDLLGAGPDVAQRRVRIAAPAVARFFQRALQHLGDAMQRETERAQPQDAGEALEVGLVVEAVAAFAARGVTKRALRNTSACAA